jgi:hypothetical protein
MDLEIVRKGDTIALKDGSEYKVTNAVILYNPSSLKPENCIFVEWTNGQERKVSNEDIVEVRRLGLTRTDEVLSDKSLRKELDAKLQEVKALPSSRERSICITKLQEAVMWLGMDLKRLNEADPYPSSKDPSTGDRIEPTADDLKL